MTDTRPVVLKAEHLGITFGGLKAVSDFNMEIHEGELMGLIGPNGAGKTTFFNCISGVYTPNEGTIVFEGQHIEGKKGYQICEAGLSRTYQVINLSWKMTALENILVGMHSNLKSTFWQSLFHTKFQREEEQAALARARELLDFVGLRDRENELASSLSYGEQQMLAIGRALINRPKLMILDEPSLGLAPIIIREIFESIKRINAEGTTILFVEQNARIALATAQRSYVLQAGKIELTDTCENLISNEEVQRIYLGTN